MAALCRKILCTAQQFLWKERYALPDGMNIILTKNIPAAAGLAGGSSDCAATLLGINELYNLGLSLDELCDIGVTLGADVPFCIRKGTMLSEGIGEILTPLTPLPSMWTLLIKPNISVSTAYVYGNLDLQKQLDHPDTDAVLDAIAHCDGAKVAHLLSNVLETVTIPKYPVLAELKQFLLENGAVGALMSGSGELLMDYSKTKLRHAWLCLLRHKSTPIMMSFCARRKMYRRYKVLF